MPTFISYFRERTSVLFLNFTYLLLEREEEREKNINV